MSNYETYDTIKSKINLLDYIYSQGYELDKKKSSAKWLVLENTSNDKLLYNTQDNFYKNTQIDEDKGDLINFVANRLNGPVIPDKSKTSIYEAIQKLKGFNISDAADLIEKQQKIVKKKKLLSELSKTELNHKPITDYSYLINERKISLKTLSAPKFRGTLYNSYYRIPSTGHIITNFAFGLKDENGELKGMEVRNKNFNSINGDHTCFYMSNYDKEKPVNYVFFGESGIDILSYYEIYSKQESLENKNYLFISSSGNLYEEKLNKLGIILDQVSDLNTKIISITDNDKVGVTYDHNLEALYLLKYKGEEYKFSGITTNQTFNTYSFNHLSPGIINQLKVLISENHNKINKELNSNNEGYGKYIIMNKTNDKININLPRDITIKDPFMIGFKNIFKTNHILSHKPKNKRFSDWNDVLKSKKKIETKTLKPEQILNRNKKKRIRI